MSTGSTFLPTRDEAKLFERIAAFVLSHPRDFVEAGAYLDREYSLRAINARERKRRAHRSSPRGSKAHRVHRRNTTFVRLLTILTDLERLDLTACSKAEGARWAYRVLYVAYLMVDPDATESGPGLSTLERTPFSDPGFLDRWWVRQTAFDPDLASRSRWRETLVRACRACDLLDGLRINLPPAPEDAPSAGSRSRRRVPPIIAGVITHSSRGIPQVANWEADAADAVRQQGSTHLDSGPEVPQAVPAAAPVPEDAAPRPVSAPAPPPSEKTVPGTVGGGGGHPRETDEGGEVQHSADDAPWASIPEPGRLLRHWTSILPCARRLCQLPSQHRNASLILRRLNEHTGGPLRYAGRVPEVHERQLEVWLKASEARERILEAKRTSEAMAALELRERGGIRAADQGFHEEQRPNARGKAR